MINTNKKQQTNAKNYSKHFTLTQKETLWSGNFMVVPSISNKFKKRKNNIKTDMGYEWYRNDHSITEDPFIASHDL